MSIEVGRPLGWEPRSKPQKALLDAIGIVDFCLFGGAVGSLKTATMLVDAAQEYQNPNLHALLMRETQTEMKMDLLRKAQQLYTQMGASWDGGESAYVWPWGATVRFGYMAHDGDLDRYYGSEFSYIGIDESTKIPFPRIQHVMTRLRSTNPDLKRRVRLVTNPGGVSGNDHKAVFMGDRCIHCVVDENSRRPFNVYSDAVWPSSGRPINRTTCYIPGKLTDHVGLLNEDYAATLAGLPDALRMALLEGCWESFEGQYFTVWNFNQHTVNWETANGVIGLKHQLKNYFTYWVSCDYGFGTSHTSAYLHVKTPDGMIYTIDEIDVQHMDAPDASNYIKTRWEGLIDDAGFERQIQSWFLSPDAWQSRGMRSDSGKSIAEQMQNETGVMWEQASNDRAAGAMYMFGLLKSGKWKVCADRCPHLTKALPSRIHDPERPEDVLKIKGDPGDDQYDGVRYGLLSWIQAPKKPRAVLIAEYVNAEDPTVRAMQARIAQQRYAPKSTVMNYRSGKVGRA